MQDADAHCERLVREADKDRFLATLFAPESRRPHLFALYAFHAEIVRVPEMVSGPMPGEIRLQWWREVISGERDGEAAAHPVASALLQAVREFALPAADLMGLIEAHAFDLYDDPMPTWRALEGYAERTSSALFALAARILERSGPPANGALALHGGIAAGLSRVLADFPHQARRRRLYVPMEAWVEHGARPEQVFAGEATDAVRATLAAVRQRARDRLRQAREAADAISDAVQPAFLPLALTRAWLDRLERAEPFVPVSFPQWRRQWVLWRASRSGLRRALG